MTAISIDTQSPLRENKRQPLVNWLRQRIVAYRQKRKLKAEEKYLQSLDPRLLRDMGIDPASIPPKPNLTHLIPHLVVVSVFQDRAL